MSNKLKLTTLLIVSIIILYYFPPVKFIYFNILLIIFYKSKNDVLWLVFILIFMQAPGGIFYPPRSSYFIVGTNGISFTYFFILLAFLKTITKHNNISLKNHFKSIIIIPIYSMVLFVISLLIGIGLSGYKIFAYVICSLLFFYSLLKMVDNKDKLREFIDLVFFAIIVLFLWQMFDILSPTKLATLVGVTKESIQFFDLESDIRKGQIIRIFYAATFSLMGLFASLFYLLKDRGNNYSNKYLFLITGISFLSIALTATRGYILQYIFIIFVFFLLSKRKSIGILLMIPIILLSFMQIFPLLEIQINLAFERIFTLSNLISGDASADGTLIRITHRAPKVWGKYLESPIFGFGYSDIGINYNDDHVGNYTLLLQGGLIGAAIYLALLSNIINKLAGLVKNNYKKKEGIFIISLIISLIISHSTSSTVFSYYLEPHTISIFAFIFIMINLEIYE